MTTTRSNGWPATSRSGSSQTFGRGGPLNGPPPSRTGRPAPEASRRRWGCSNTELLAHVGQFDLPPGLRRLPFVRDHGGALNPCAGDQPAVRARGELRLGVVEVPPVALYPHHDLRVGTHDSIGIHREEELLGNFFLDPPHEILCLGAREEFAPNSVDAEDPAPPVVVQHALPEPGAQAERVVQVLRRDEHIRVHEVGRAVRHGRSTPSRLAYFWKVPPRRPVRS